MLRNSITRVIQHQKSALNQNHMRAFSLWAHVPQAPVDATIGPKDSFLRSSHPRKVLLGQGTYRCDEGKPYILNCVREAKDILARQNLDHEYASIDGIASFNQKCVKLAYGANCEAVRSKRIVSCQSLSGTGSIRLGMEFLREWYPNKRAKVFCPNPTWPFHYPIAQNSGFETASYRYYDKVNKCFDLNGMLEDLDRCENEQIVILHVCAHNPTGCDPSPDEWSQILDVMQRKRHFAAFDTAYQGFASGNIDRDAYSLRLFATNMERLFLAQSFSKNFGLYGERAGCLSFITDSESEAKKVQSRVKTKARPMYSSPPIYGARIVDTVLGDDQLTLSWKNDLVLMSARIKQMRRQLVDNLAYCGSQLDWSHITRQIGMFAYTGFNEQQVRELAEVHHIFMTNDGRISIAGLNSNNVDYVAEAFHSVSMKSILRQNTKNPEFNVYHHHPTLNQSKVIQLYSK